MLAQMLGQSPAEQKAMLEEAKENANDLNGLVRKKKPAGTKPPTTANGVANSASSSGNGKRKLEDTDENELDGKKTRVE